MTLLYSVENFERRIEHLLGCIYIHFANLKWNYMEFILHGDFNKDFINKNKTCCLVKDRYNFSTMFDLGQLIVVLQELH